MVEETVYCLQVLHGYAHKFGISNRYKAKRKRYEGIDILDDFKLKPVIRAILEIAEEINQPEIINE